MSYAKFIGMQAILVMFRSDGDRRSFSIARDMTVVGRREDCDLRIPLGEVSRKHCRLVRDGDSLRLEDLGSSNGTYLNGQRVQEATLTAGDSVQIGPVVFVLQVDGSPADEDLHPVSANLEDATGHHHVEGDEGPLSPTSQSEVEDLIEGLDPLPEDAEHHHAHTDAASESGAHAAHADGGEEMGELEMLDGDEHTDAAPAAEDELIDLDDLTVDPEHQSHT